MTTATAAPARPAPQQSGQHPGEELSHREILEVLAGLLAALFTAIVSSTIVSNALPTIISDLEGTQRQYTWVITTSLLAMTVTTPIWAKLSDLFSKKVLVQTAIVVFVLGSMAAGISQNVGELLGARVVQGLGMGGLTALAQSIIGSVIPPRSRGRYSGYMGATMALATVSGPLIGGVIVDTDWLGWRWCFFVCVPLAVVALVILQKFLHVTTYKRKVRLDWGGALLIAIAASLPLLWVTFAGTDYAWLSWQTAAFLGGAVVAAVLAVLVESKHPEPLVPLFVVKERTTALAIVASLAVGIAMFGGSVFLGQYFQIARGYSPTEAGLLTVPMMLGSLVGTAGSGAIITRTGRWKRFLVAGSLLLVAGLGLLGTIDHTTPIWHLSLFMAVMGLGMGMLLQNLVLAVQNTVDVTQVGAASGTVAFFRSLGGAIGVSVLGAVLANRVTDLMTSGLVQLGIDPSRTGSGTGTLDLTAMPAPIAALTRTAYGDATAQIFLIGACVAVVSVVAVLAIREVALRTTVRKLDSAEPGVESEITEAPAVATEPRPSHRVEVPESDAERQELQAVAAVDVLTQAERVAEQRDLDLTEAVSDAVDVVRGLRESLGETFRQVERQLTEIEDRLPERAAPRTSVSPLDGERTHGELTDSLRRYELALLQESQKVADDVVAEARDEEQRLRVRIDELRSVEERLREDVRAHLGR
jgi:EmrB/QacA subfamily drug resistance transporter